MTQRPVVFDRAAAHMGSVRARGLPDRQAYVHGGLFFGWAVDRGLVASWVEESAPEAFAAYRSGRITGPGLFERLDGAIVDDQFTDEGLAFVVSYFDPRNGAFVSDYLQTMAAGLPSEFHVEDDDESAARLSSLLDGRLAEWRATWDAARGRPDVRADPARGGEWPEPSSRIVVPVVPIGAGVPLPGGPLGIRAGRPGTLAAVERALATDKRLLLLPRPPEARAVPLPDPEAVGQVGVLAVIDTVTPARDRPGAKDVLVQCQLRVELQGWEPPSADPAGAPLARGVVWPEPPVMPDDLALVDEIRSMAADVVRRRSERGDPPGRVALGAVLAPEALLDVLAGDLAASRHELLTVLEAPDLATRCEVVRQLLEREP